MNLPNLPNLPNLAKLEVNSQESATLAVCFVHTHFKHIFFYKSIISLTLSTCPGDFLCYGCEIMQVVWCTQAFLASSLKNLKEK